MAEPLVIEIYGPEGIGKTYTGLSFPNPVMIDTEGRGRYICALLQKRAPYRVREWQDLRETASRILSEVPPPATVVIDSASDLQDMASLQWARENGVSTAQRPNYSAVYRMIDAALDFWTDNGYHLVLLERVKQEYDPVAEGYTGRMVPNRYGRVSSKTHVVLELQWGLVLEGVQVLPDRYPVAVVRKNVWLPMGVTKPYLLRFSYPELIQQLQQPWKGTVHDYLEEAKEVVREMEATAVLMAQRVKQLSQEPVT